MIRKLMVIGLLIGAAVLTASAAAANSTTVPATEKPGGISIELGKADFRTYCAACHGVSGVGDGTVAEFMTIAAADLTKLSWKNAGAFPRQKVPDVIDGRADVRVHGARDMPVWGDWFNAEAVGPDMDATAREEVVRMRIESLTNYIETLQVK
jgi:mono/diheme cytochrome c family protein